MIEPGSLAPLVIAARAFLGLVLITAAVAKFRDTAAFHGAVHGYRLLPSPLVGPVARAVPPAELALGLLLPTGLLPVPSAVAAATLFTIFALAMAANILRGRRDIDCGCFRRRPSQRLGWGAVARTFGLAIVAGMSGVAAPASLSAIAQGLVAAATGFLLFATVTSLPTLPRKQPRIVL